MIPVFVRGCGVFVCWMTCEHIFGKMAKNGLKWYEMAWGESKFSQIQCASNTLGIWHKESLKISHQFDAYCKKVNEPNC